MTLINSQSLCGTVQRNCNISDARYAANYTLCVYLLKMREFYRWEMGYPFSASMPNEELGSWLTQRERLWETLEEEPFVPIEIDGCFVDPFHTELINRSLVPKGYVYSGGLGRQATPHFFLGQLEKQIETQGFKVLIAADECARDLTAPPAMTLDKTIFLRRESLQRMIWEKVQEWQWNKPDNAMARALSFYDFDGDPDTALEQMTEHELHATVLHEIGEIMAGESLDDYWATMLNTLPRSRTEFMARAVRDHLADALSTLPKLLYQEDVASLHFYMANLIGMRKELFPSLLEAYERFVHYGDFQALERLLEKSPAHWLAVAKQMLDLYQQYECHCPPYLEALMETSQL